jgi:hypothetical protein
MPSETANSNRPEQPTTRSTARTRTGIGLVAGIAALTGLAALSAGPAEAGKAASYHGVFRETAAGAGLEYDIAGSAKMTVAAGSTVVVVNIAGLDPTKTYGSHLHNGTCASGGGMHYQDVPGPVVTPPNELWLSTSANPLGGLSPNPGGVAHGDGSAAWEARTASTTATNARSIIVHEPVSGTRIACADLG